MSAPDLRVNIGGLTLRNPVMLASGAFGYGDEFAGLADYGELGALVLKTITLEPRAGNPPASRTAETPAGMVNSIGLENVGLEAFVRDKLPMALSYGTAVIASIAGDTPEEFAACARRLDRCDVAAVEINISCPNVQQVGRVAGGTRPGDKGMAFGVDAEASAEVVRAVRSATRRPIIAKLTPNVTDICSIAKACEGAGADAVALTNTFSAMVINVETRQPVLAANTGGLSGPAIRPAAVLRVFQAAGAVSVPVVGMGGVWNASDALEFILAGATAVAIGTALYADPAVGNRVLAGIRDYLVRHRLAGIRELIGAVELR